MRTWVTATSPRSEKSCGLPAPTSSPCLATQTDRGDPHPGTDANARATRDGSHRSRVRGHAELPTTSNVATGSARPSDRSCRIELANGCSRFRRQGRGSHRPSSRRAVRAAAHGPPGREPSGGDDPAIRCCRSARSRTRPRVNAGLSARRWRTSTAASRCCRCARTRRRASDLIRRTRGRPGWRQLVKKPATATEVCDWFELDPTVRRRRAHRRGLERRRRRRRRPRARAAVPTTATVTTRRGVHAYVRPNGPSAPASTPGARSAASAPTSSHPAPVEPTVAPTPGSSRRRTPASPISPRSKTAPAPTYIRTTCFRRTTCLDHELEGLRALADLERDERVALRLARALGAPDDVAIGASFPCLIHADANPSASLWRYEADAQRPLPRLARRQARRRSVAPARARACAPRREDAAAQPTRARDLEAASRARGRARSSRSRSSDPPRRVDGSRTSGTGFLDLLALRWTVTPGAPAPYSARFAAAWCGVSTHRAHEAIGALARAGSLRLVGRDPRGTRLWLPEGVMPLD